MHSSCLYIKRYKNGQGGLKFTLIPPANGKTNHDRVNAFHRSRSCLTPKLSSFQHQTRRDFRHDLYKNRSRMWQRFRRPFTINTDCTVLAIPGSKHKWTCSTVYTDFNKKSGSVRMLYSWRPLVTKFKTYDVDFYSVVDSLMAEKDNSTRVRAKEITSC